jgi:hypothetical protein
MKKPTSTRSLLTIPFAVPAYWTPEQALAVFELLDELREMIANHYSTQLFEEAREQYAHLAQSAAEGNDDDPVF